MKKLKKLFVFVFIILIIITIATVIINIHIVSSTRKYIYDNLDSVPERYTAIVLGAGVRNGHPTPIFQERLQTGEELISKGKAHKMLITGDHGQKKYDEVNTALQFIKNNHSDTDFIFLDHAGFSTYESMYRARDVFQVKDAIVITQDFHIHRSVYIARQLGIDAVGCRTINIYQYPKMSLIKWNIRELLARVKTFFLIKTNAKPTYLGEPIPITGSGIETQGM